MVHPRSPLLLLGILLHASSGLIFAAPQAAGPATAASPRPGVIQYTNPSPRYPLAAKAAEIEGRGTVQVTYDMQGKPTRVEMIKTTGSLILGRSTTIYVEQHWKSSGGQRTIKTTEVDYQLPPKRARTKLPPPTAVQARRRPVSFSHPPYPAIARYKRLSGRVTVRATYSAQGGPVRTEILKSSGSDILDGYTADYIRLYWKNYNPEPYVLTTSIEYRLAGRW